jgi:hypothetical protein
LLFTARSGATGCICERQLDPMMPGRGQSRSFCTSLFVTALAGLAACGTAPAAKTAKRAPPVRQVSAGDVALDSVTQAVNAHWLTDSNVVALLSVIDSRQMDLAHEELQAWASDTVQMLAVNMLHSYQAQQQSLDSLASALALTGSMPALGVALDTSLQRHTAVLAGLGAARLDSAFLREARVQAAWAAGYFTRLSALATAPELAAFAATAANRATLQLHQITQLMVQRAAPPSDSTQSSDSTRRRRPGGQ